MSDVQPHTIVITDPGVDDAVGILVMAAARKSVDFVATYGNAETSLTTRNLNGITSFIADNLHVADVHITSFQGADRQLNAEKPYIPEGGNLFFIHGEHAMEGLFKNAAVEAVPSEQLDVVEGTDVLSLGATTELARLLRTQKNHIRSITMMGGALYQQGNVAPHVEANLAHDSVATSEILQIVKKESIPFTLVPLDLTQHPDLVLTMDRLNNIISKLQTNGSEHIASFIEHLCGENSTYRNFYLQKEGVYDSEFHERRFGGCAIHDLTAVLVKHHPELFRFADLPIIIEKNGALGIPTGWMGLPQEKIRVAVGVLNPDMYWQKTEEYLAAYK